MKKNKQVRLIQQVHCATLRMPFNVKSYCKTSDKELKREKKALADEIKEDVKSFLKTLSPYERITFITDCTEDFCMYCGISRSGAVGKAVNEIANIDNKEDYDFFYGKNTHIQPNFYVYSKIMQELRETEE